VTNSGALQQKQTGHGEEGCNHTKVKYQPNLGMGGGGNYITILKGEDQCWAPSVLSLSGNHLLRTSRGVIFPIIYHITSI